MNHGPYIRLHSDPDDRLCVTVTDYELHDMLEDYLIEDCNLDIEIVLREDWPKPGDYTIVINSGLSYDQLAMTIKKIDLAEIERVYSINN